MSAPAKTSGHDLDDASLYSREPYIAALRLIPHCHRIDNAPDLLDIVIQKFASKYGGRHYTAIRDPARIISLHSVFTESASGFSRWEERQNEATYYGSTGPSYDTFLMPRSGSAIQLHFHH